ncbi:MAG: oxygenase MpaB family protein [Pseudomonadota bacterium]
MNFDFTRPEGEPALAAPDSVSWRVFKNPVSLFIGGVTAVLLELAEPRVRSGVWDHTSFRTDPLPRMKRTGLAAMITVYGPRSRAEAMIAGVGRMHARVDGLTPDGVAYRADDPELLDWVQATASYGFMEAYHAFVRPLSADERDRVYAEAAPAAALYGAVGAPRSVAGQEAQFQAMRPRLERSEIVFEFLQILRRTEILPGVLRPLQGMFIRAAIEILPAWSRELLGLDVRWGLRGWERTLIRAAGAMADRFAVSASPAVQASKRMGLPADYLYRQ